VPIELTPGERDLLHQHPIIAQRILGATPAMHDAARLVRNSHERYDGHGYPDRLDADEIRGSSPRWSGPSPHRLRPPNRPTPVRDDDLKAGRLGRTST
jgi:hypothetical protein